MIPNYVLFRQLIAVWFALDALHFAVHARTWLGEGMDEKRWWTKQPVVWAMLASWLALSAGLFFGVSSLLASVGFFLLFRHLYIGSRWRSLLRGVGAVGFMPYWVALALVLMEGVLASDRADVLAPAMLRMLRIDFAVIFLCAGTYKSLTGYVRGEGIEYALANPIWTYGFGLFRRINPKSIIMRLTNLSLPAGQFGIGVLLLLPFAWTQSIGAVLAMISFFSIGVAFRIGRLGLLMSTIPLLFLPELHVMIVTTPIAAPLWHAPSLAVKIIVAATWAYIAILPIVKIVQYVNLFLNRALPKPLQWLVDRYAGIVPIIIWRVFSVDITNFFVRIYDVHDDGTETEIVGEKSAYSPFTWKNLYAKIRWLFVGESVAIAALFNTQKHFASRPKLFDDKLLRYARSMDGKSPLRFEYVLIAKESEQIVCKAITSYIVNRETGEIREERAVADKSPATVAKFSPIRESVGYGSYVRLKD